MDADEVAYVLWLQWFNALQETSYGVLRPPLGSVRLTIIELVAVLLRTGSEEAERAIIGSSAVQEVLQVFLRFPFNSILHHQARSSLTSKNSDPHLSDICDVSAIFLASHPSQSQCYCFPPK
jgi:serine/threonine-protein phosphatase 6 regulatory subunit 3